MQEDIAKLPLSARIHFIQKVLKAELHMRRTASISDKQRKIKEIEECLRHLENIDEEFHRAKSVVIEHKEVMAALTAAVERHGANQDMRADKALIVILDSAKEAA